MPKVKVICLPPGEGGAKVGLDDFLAAGHPLSDLISLAVDDLPGAHAGESDFPPVPYAATEQGLVWHKPVKEGTIQTPLTNFAARIVTDVAEDDGTEVRHIFEIEAHLAERTKHFEVSSMQFHAMTWPTEQLGARAIVYPGFGLQDHARAAIQMLSDNISEKRIYAHIGWRRIRDQWVYLHAGGAIGPDGQVPGVEVRLPEALARFSLPAPLAGEELIRAVRASLKLLKLTLERVTFPSYAAMVRAAMATADFSEHFSGLTGAAKTALAALLQQHYGADMVAEHLPGAWSSTGNALEGLAFQAKDALLVVDDFAPAGGQFDVQRQHREADRVLRAQGNNSARQRMRPDGTLRAPKPPRGLILSTGEDIPRGQSLRARMLIIEMKREDLDWNLLTECQKDAADGLYAQALAGFLQRLAPKYDQVLSDLRSKVAKLRQEATGSATHRRIPMIVANLMVGLESWFRYAEEVGALTSTEAEDLLHRGWAALGEAAKAQQEHQEASDPTKRFIELLTAAIASGRAHVAASNGNWPDGSMRWGWRSVDMGGVSEWRPQGERIGWVEDDDLYLEPHASFAIAQRLAHDEGESITVGAKTLHKRLHEKGLLASTERGRHRLTIRRHLQGHRRIVLHLRASLLSPPEKAQ